MPPANCPLARCREPPIGTLLAGASGNKRSKTPCVPHSHVRHQDKPPTTVSWFETPSLRAVRRSIGCCGWLTWSGNTRNEPVSGFQRLALANMPKRSCNRRVVFHFDAALLGQNMFLPAIMPLTRDCHQSGLATVTESRQEATIPCYFQKASPHA